VQTTLLGVAIAFIVALVAALVGPHFIDWNQFRPQFEAAAARVVGVPVRVTGDMRATLLPVPSLRLGAVEVGDREGGPGRASAEALAVEFNLGALMRGEWRATELTINGMALDFGLDWRGRIAWPAGMGGVDLGALAIDRLNVTGRVTLHDGASRATLNLEDIAFTGDVRALAGALRGEGNASVNGVRYPFRISSNPAADGEGMKLHAIVTAPTRALGLDLDGELRFVAARPQFDGALTLERRADGSAGGGRPPWRIATKLKADPAAARFDQLEGSYGADAAPAKFTGSGELRFGAAPQLRLAVKARQIDADRLLGAHDTDGARGGWAAFGALAGGVARPPLPVAIEARIETVTLAGRPVQEVGATLRGSAADWRIAHLEARLPGATDLTVREAVLPADGGFSGGVAVASADPDALLAWLRGRGEAAARIARPLRAEGRLDGNARQLAVTDLRADLAGDSFGGRLSVSGLDRADGVRAEAALSAERLDLDAAGAMLQALSGGAVPWPREADLALEIAHAVVGGQEVAPVALRLAYGPQAITLDRLTFGAGRGIAVEGKGAFDRAASTGQVTLAATAPSLAPFAGLLRASAPALAARLAAVPAGRAPARLKLTAALGGPAARSDHGQFMAALDLDAAPLAGHATLTAAPPLAAIGGIDLDALARTEIGFDARLTAGSAAPLLALVGLDGVAAAGPGAATLEASATGPARQPLRVTGKLSANGFEASATGSAEPFAAAPSATLAVALRKADLAPLAGLAAPFPVTGAARLAWADGRLAADAIDLLVAGARVRGSLAQGADGQVDGELGLDRLSIPAVFGYAMGGSVAGGAPADDLAHLRRLQDWRGRIAFRTPRALLPGGAELAPFSGQLRADGRSLTLDAVKGGIGGGQVSGDLDTRRTDDDMLLSARVLLAGADGAALRYHALALPPGRVGVQMTLASQGRSAAGLLGALSGSGALTLDNARIGGLDPRAFEVALAAAEGKQTVAEETLRAAVAPALAGGALSVANAEIAFNIKDGRLRAGPATLDGDGAQAIVTGGYEIAAGRFDIRANLTSTRHGSAASRPDLALVMEGTPDAPHVATDVSSLASWLALRSIERETQRLDAIERGSAAARASRSGGTAPPSPPSPPVSQPAPEAPAAAPAPPRPPAAAPLPPPVEVRPAPPGGPSAKPPTARPPLVLMPQPVRP
jgi:large subunit ribosomal protein L24